MLHSWSPPRTAIVVVSIVLVGAACSSSTAPEVDGVTVVATTTMLGDIARNIVGDDGTVTVLLPIGVDAHDFQPTSAQVAAIYEADLVIANGLGLEVGLEDVLEAAASDGANIVEVAELVNPLTFGDRTPCGVDTDGACDPHVWLDPARDAAIALIVGDQLEAIDSSVDWQDRSIRYADQLREADLAITRTLSAVPDGSRFLVTNHDFLGYLADRYGFEVVGNVYPGGSTLSDPSSSELARLVATVNEMGVSAIFAEVGESTGLAEAIADEADHPVEVIPLYAGSIGESGSGADSLIGMLMVNAERIADGLSQ